MPDTNTVSDYMSDKPVTLHPDMDVMEAVQVLTERRIPGAPVVDDLGNLVGLLAERDCLEAVLKACYHGEWGGRVSEYMQTNVRTIEAATSIVDAARLFIETSLRGFPQGTATYGQPTQLLTIRNCRTAIYRTSDWCDSASEEHQVRRTG